MLAKRINLTPIQFSRHETRIMIVSFLVLVGLAIIRSTQSYIKYAATVDYFSVPLTLLYNFIVFSSYVLFTPLIIKMIHQFPISRQQPKTNILIHIGFSGVFGIIQMVFCNLVLYMIGLSSTPIMSAFITKYITGIIQFHLLAYWIILLFMTSGRPGLFKKTKLLERFIIKENKYTTFLELEKVQWIEALDHYQKLHTDSGFYLYKDSMTNLIKQLPKDQFMRVHRSSIININQVEGLRKSDSQLVAKLQNGNEVPVGKSYRNEVKSLFS